MTIKDGVSFGALDQERHIPTVLQPVEDNLDINTWIKQNRAFLLDQLNKTGALLFRGFGVDSAEQFESALEDMFTDILPYTDRTSPRREVGNNVFTATEYPADRTIYLHNEQSYNLSFPRIISFCCTQQPEVRGETPIADTRRILARLPAEAVAAFREKKYRFTRNFDGMFGLPWQTAFRTDDKTELEQYFAEHDIQHEWLDSKKLRTHQVREVIAKHPITGEKCWFNHLTFFNFSTQEPEIQELLSSLYSEPMYPHQTYYGDGSAIDVEYVSALREAYAAEKVKFTWQKGDFLVLDNVLCCHGREPFEGRREILTAMCKPVSWIDCKE